jgi:hypothetical protein
LASYVFVGRFVERNMKSKQSEAMRREPEKYQGFYELSRINTYSKAYNGNGFKFYQKLQEV